MTGLPEYRNGGLFIDTGVLTLKPDDEKRGLARFKKEGELSGKGSMEVVPMFTPDDDVIVEWRAVTVGFLDLLLEEVNSVLGLQGLDKLSLPQMLEAGSWKVGFALLLISRHDCNANNQIGRTRNGRDIPTKYPMPTNRHPQRRYSLLILSSLHSTHFPHHLDPLGFDLVIFARIRIYCVYSCLSKYSKLSQIFARKELRIATVLQFSTSCRFRSQFLHMMQRELLVTFF